MPSRNVTDVAGRVWQCQQLDSREKRLQTQDVRIRCTTGSVPAPVSLTVGWEWHNMPDNLLARLITNVAPSAEPPADRRTLSTSRSRPATHEENQ